MDEAAIAKAAKELYAEYPIEQRVIRRLLRNQVNRTKGSPLYDLDYDLQLNEALRIVSGKDYEKLMSSTKTLKELQEEVAQE